MMVVVVVVVKIVVMKLMIGMETGNGDSEEGGVTLVSSEVFSCLCS